MTSLEKKVADLLSSLIPLYEVMEDGSISSSNMSVELYESALLQLLDVRSSNLNPLEFERCARMALQETIRRRSAFYTEFKAELDNNIEKFKRDKYLDFWICSRCHFSVPHDFRLDIELWGAKLTITQAAPKGISTTQPSLPNGMKALATPEFGAYLTMTVRERTGSGALERASRDISFLLGILNFALNLGNLTFFSIGNENPLPATIFPGREIFLLDEYGKANEDIWRYYTIHPKSTQNLSQSEILKLKNHVNIVERLKSIPKCDRKFYRQVFELYFDSITESDADIIAMRLWKAAEHLTMSTSAQEIADRLALTWLDKKAVSAVCFALGHRRNWTMHNANPNIKIDSITDHFRHFLEILTWQSLSLDIKGTSHWKTIMQMSNMDISQLDLAADTISILKNLHRPAP